MIARIVLAALLAGSIAGVLAWGGHMAKTTPLILKAEAYEQPAPAHSAGAPAAAAEAWEPEEGFQRHAFTFVFDIVTAIGFAFVLTGAMVLSGRPVDAARGVWWGLAGFAAAYGAPALGLAPELPGMAAADLSARQLWWAGTVVATAGGLALVFLSRPVWLRAAGIGLVVLPHLIGAPDHAPDHGAVPAALAAEFVAASLVVALAFWVALGALGGHFLKRFGAAEA